MWQVIFEIYLESSAHVFVAIRYPKNYEYSIFMLRNKSNCNSHISLSSIYILKRYLKKKLFKSYFKKTIFIHVYISVLHFEIKLN